MLNKNVFLLFIPVVVLSFLFSCASTEIANSEDVKQSKIYQSYYVIYDNQKEMVNAEAMFRFGGSGGTTLKLNEPSKVFVNNNLMEGDDRLFRGMVYSYDNLDINTKSFKFQFIDTDKNEYINTHTIVPIQLQAPDTISKTTPVSITWEGEPTGEAETVIIEITDNADNKAVISTKLKQVNTIKIQPNDLTKLQTGVANIQVIREKDVQLQNAAEIGGILHSTFKSKISVIHIKP